MMKKIIWLSAFIILLFPAYRQVEAMDHCVPPDPHSTSSVYWYTQCMLPRYNVLPLQANWIFQHESAWDSSRVGDTAFVCPKTGEVSPSYGLAQINIGCYH